MVSLPFLKKKEVVHPGGGVAPIDRVREMAGRGFSEAEMIDILRREGYSPTEIDSALMQALKAGVSETPAAAPSKTETQPATSSPPEMKLPTLDEIIKSGYVEGQKGGPLEETSAAGPPQIPETSLPPEYYSSYPTEDYIDYIVQSHLSEVKEKLTDFSIRYKDLDKKLTALQQQLTEISQSRGGEQREILTKIDGFNETVGDVTTRVGSMERAFKETLPALIESVRILSDLVQRVKREA